MYVNRLFDAEAFNAEGGLLIVPHVPKTAGTTLHHVLAEALKEKCLWFSGEPTMMDPAIRALESLSPEQKQELKLVIGHMPFGLHNAFPGRPCKYISVVREPVVRAASHYAHEYRHHILKEDRGSRLLASEGAAEFLRLCNAAGENVACNQQCQLLFPDVFANGSLSENTSIAERSEAMISLMEEWYVLIGCTEKLDDFLKILINDILRISGEVDSPRSNTGLDAQTTFILSEPEAAEIRSWNELDVWLWQYISGGACSVQTFAPDETERLRAISELRRLVILNSVETFGYLKKDRAKAADIMNAQAAENKRLNGELSRLAADISALKPA